MAVDGIAKGRQYTSKTKLGQLWTDVWDEYESCESRGININVLKVKSHEKDTNKVPQELQDGNNCADYHAERGSGNALAGKLTGYAISIAERDGSKRG